MAIETRKSSEMVASLNPLYAKENTANEEAHVQEHIFERRCHYAALAKFFDCLNDHSRCRRRKLMNRVIRLGGMPLSRLGDVKVFDAVKPAIEQAHARHTELFEGYQAAIEEAQKVRDHHTHKILMFLQARIDCIIAVLEAVYAQADDLGDEFLLLCIKKLPKP